MAAWDDLGYDELELLGFGSAGEVWQAQDRATGDGVVLRRLPGDNPGVVAALVATAAVIATLPSRHLVRLRTTLRAGGDDVLVLDLAGGGALSALLARRVTLVPGEVVTAMAPIAEVLGQAHARGLIHGRIGLSAVLLSKDGMPLLDGLGTAALHPAPNRQDPAPDAQDPALDRQDPAPDRQGSAPDRQGSALDRQGSAPDRQDPARRPASPSWSSSSDQPAAVDPLAGSAERPSGTEHIPAGGLPAMADVAALGALCRLLLTGSPGAALPASTPAALRRAIESALEPDPRARPCAADLALALLAACPALPLRPAHRLPSTGTSSRPPAAAASARRRPAPGTLLAVGSVTSLLLAVVVGWSWGRHADLPAGRAPAARALPPAAGAAPAPAPGGPVAAPARPGGRAGGGAATPGAGRLAAAAEHSAAPGGSCSTAPAQPILSTGAGSPGRSGATAVADPDWRQIVDTLDAAREAAFRRGCSAMLGAVWAPRSGQHWVDIASIGGLTRLGRTAVGVRHLLRSVRVVRADSVGVQLDVVEALQPYAIRGAGLSVPVQVAAGTTTRARMVLTRTASGWRVLSVRL